MIFLICSFINVFVKCQQVKKGEFFFFTQTFLLRVVMSQSPRSSLSLIDQAEVYGLEVSSSNTDICKIWMRYLPFSSPLNKKNLHMFNSLSLILYSSSLSRLEFVLFDFFLKCEQSQNLSKCSVFIAKRGRYFFTTFRVSQSCIQFIQLLITVCGSLDFLFLHNRHISYLNIKERFSYECITIALLTCLNESKLGLNDNIRNLFSTTFQQLSRFVSPLVHTLIQELQLKGVHVFLWQRIFTLLLLKTYVNVKHSLTLD